MEAVRRRWEAAVRRDWGLRWLGNLVRSHGAAVRAVRAATAAVGRAVTAMGLPEVNSRVVTEMVAKGKVLNSEGRKGRGFGMARGDDSGGSGRASGYVMPPLRKRGVYMGDREEERERRVKEATSAATSNS